MTFKELLNSVTFEEVAPCLLQMHPDAEGSLKWYKIHFDMLRQMTPKHHDDANSDVCHITMEKWRNGKMILDADPMEGDLWEHSLTKEIILAPDVKATNAEIAACCIWHTSFYGFVDKQAQEYLRFDEDDLDIKDRWNDSIYNKVKAKQTIFLHHSQKWWSRSYDERVVAIKEERTNQTNQRRFLVYQ